LSDGTFLVDGKTVTWFANVEEDFSDTFVDQQVMLFRLENELKQGGANFVQGGLFKAFAVRDGRPITGQQQYAARKVARGADRDTRRLTTVPKTTTPAREAKA
jgi:putative intracellular protease/amidase